MQFPTIQDSFQKFDQCTHIKTKKLDNNLLRNPKIRTPKFKLLQTQLPPDKQHQFITPLQPVQLRAAAVTMVTGQFKPRTTFKVSRCTAVNCGEMDCGVSALHERCDRVRVLGNTRRCAVGENARKNEATCKRRG